MTLRMRIAALLLPLALVACGGGGGGGGGTSNAPPPANFLTVADVEKVIAQAVFESQAQNAKAAIAVVDRVGNVLGVYVMTGAPMFTISSGTGAVGGLEGAGPLPPEFAAISMAVTGAYLSSTGNAFSTRTASQIVQDHFNPNEFKQPGGPLFGVQFQPAVVLGSHDEPGDTHRRHYGPEAHAARVSPPSRAACRCTRTASSSAASESWRRACIRSTSTS